MLATKPSLIVFEIELLKEKTSQEKKRYKLGIVNIKYLVTKIGLRVKLRKKTNIGGTNAVSKKNAEGLVILLFFCKKKNKISMSKGHMESRAVFTFSV